MTMRNASSPAVWCRFMLILPIVAIASACATVPKADAPQTSRPGGQQPERPQTSRPQPGTVRITPPQAPAPGTAGRPAVEVMNLPGLETVMGATASQLSSRYGAPNLDVREGEARKLQYRGQACVLEFYLYPTGSGEPVTTWVEARRTSDGLDVDRAACLAALQR